MRIGYGRRFGGWSRSTDFVIVVPGSSWRKVFLRKWASGKKGPITAGMPSGEKNQTQTHQLWNEAQLNRVSLVPRSIMKWRGQLSRIKMNAKKRAPLTALHATREVTATSEKKNKEGRHVGLDFYDLLIEAHPVLISDV